MPEDRAGSPTGLPRLEPLKTVRAGVLEVAYFEAGPADGAVVLLDEAVAALMQFARSEHLKAAQITAVGAFEHATVGWFGRAAGDYRRIQVDQQCELLSLLGDVAEGNDGPILHLHAVLGLSDRTTVEKLDPDRAAQLWQLSASLLAAANGAEADA